MTDMVIPPEAIRAAAKAIYENDLLPGDWPWSALGQDQERLARGRVALEAALPHLRPTACTCPTDADVTPDMRSETGQHLSGCPSDAKGLATWMDEQIERIDETKALVETATRLGRELGRREAAEEIAVSFEERAKETKLRGTREGTTLLVCATAAREIATKEPK